MNLVSSNRKEGLRGTSIDAVTTWGGMQALSGSGLFPYVDFSVVSIKAEVLHQADLRGPRGLRAHTDKRNRDVREGLSIYISGWEAIGLLGKNSSCAEKVGSPRNLKPQRPAKVTIFL